MYRGWLLANIRFGIYNRANTGFGFCNRGRTQLNPTGSRKHNGPTVAGAGRAGSAGDFTARGYVCG